MPLNQTDRMVIIDSQTMQIRITAAVIKYALYLLGGSPTTEQRAWAIETTNAPAVMARKVSTHLLSEANFLGSGSAAITGDTWVGGSSITEAQLESAVETAVNNRFIQ